MAIFSTFAKYTRLFFTFARYCLVREMSFRVNFLIRVVTTLCWLAIMVFFFDLIYLNTNNIGSWNKYSFLIFLGTSMILNGIAEAVFLENCTTLSELIRTGDLDFALLKPIDEQFLLTCQRVDWAELPGVLTGMGLVFYGAMKAGIAITGLTAVLYLVLILAGVAIMYSLLLAMASTSVWIVRNTGLYEVWFYITQFARYPGEIYKVNVAGQWLRFGLMYIIPVLLAVNVPAQFVAGLLDDFRIAFYLIGSAAVALFLSRRFFFFALRSYRSASS